MFQFGWLMGKENLKFYTFVNRLGSLLFVPSHNWSMNSVKATLVNWYWFSWFLFHNVQAANITIENSGTDTSNQESGCSSENKKFSNSCFKITKEEVQHSSTPTPDIVILESSLKPEGNRGEVDEKAEVESAFSSFPHCFDFIEVFNLYMKLLRCSGAFTTLGKPTLFFISISNDKNSNFVFMWSKSNLCPSGGVPYCSC